MRAEAVKEGNAAIGRHVAGQGIGVMLSHFLFWLMPNSCWMSPNMTTRKRVGRLVELSPWGIDKQR